MFLIFAAPAAPSLGGQLQHPGVVPVYDIGRFGDRPFFTMKLVKGQKFKVQAQIQEDQVRVFGLQGAEDQARLEIGDARSHDEVGDSRRNFTIGASPSGPERRAMGLPST